MFTRIQLAVHARELGTSEFYLAEKIWSDYHRTKSDPVCDRILAVFIEDTPVSVCPAQAACEGMKWTGFSLGGIPGERVRQNALGRPDTACGNPSSSIVWVLHLVDFYASPGLNRSLEEGPAIDGTAAVSWARQH